MQCILCCGTQVSVLWNKQDRRACSRRYLWCRSCGLVFLDPACRLAPDQERRRYDLHRNSPDAPGSRAFLGRLADPLCRAVGPAAGGLDFGCGPQPVLAEMLRAQGYRMQQYDPMYFPETKPLERTYDFVVCCEVAEHFRSPRREFDRLGKLLAGAGSSLWLMTGLVPQDRDFADWWYHRDPTHLCFYSVATFAWIAAWQGWRASFPAKDVIACRG